MRLEQLLPIFCEEVMPFQFHKGAIRTENVLARVRELPNFNSIKVRLEPIDHYLEALKDANFNSIKVRLERTGCDAEGHLYRFQFHKGAIRTRL